MCGSKNKTLGKGPGFGLELLLSMHKTLGSVPSATKKKKRETENKILPILQVNQTYKLQKIK